MDFEKVTPEEEGISSEHILSFLKRLEENQLMLHGMILMRHGKIVAETYYKPYHRNERHRMFSVTKSMVSLAVGLLCDEGKLSLDDKIIKYFPEKLPKEGVHPYIANMTIQDMLRMTTVHGKTTYKQMEDDDWVKTFFCVKPTHLAGTVFSYDTSSTHTLTALVEKLTKKDFLTYLREKVLDEIGFSKEAYCLKDPMGVSIGGSGLMASPYDMLKVMYLMSQQGVYKGKQLLPKWYLEEAVKKQADTYARGLSLEEMQGYGYQFWCTRHGGYACYGLGGQLMVVLPEKEMIFITTADTQSRQGGVQLLYDSFWQEIYEKVKEKPLAKNERSLRILQNEWNSRELSVPYGECTSSFVKKVNGKNFIIDENEKGFEAVCFRFFEEEGEFWYRRRNEEAKGRRISFGIGKNVESKIEPYAYRAVASGVWRDENTFLIRIHLVDESVGTIWIQAVFKENTVTIFLKKFVENLYTEFDGFLSGYRINDKCEIK